ncbi:formate dehydrogenase formation protein FdhE [Klebsiella pneumoniae]|nr:formate dehydrogenase formation protein FdhE [Klebsiella pneumoniae]
MSIRIIPQDELGSSEKRTAEAIPPLLFPRLKNLYNRRAERLRELAANNPLGDYLRFAALIAHAQEVVLYDHPLQMDLTARIKAASEQGKPPLDIHVLPRDKHWHKLLHSLIAELKPEMSGPALAVIENLEKASEQELEQMASALFVSDFASVSSGQSAVHLGCAVALLGADGQSDPRKSARRIRRTAPVLPGVRLDAGLQHRANRHHSGAALSALQPVRN